MSAAQSYRQTWASGAYARRELKVPSAPTAFDSLVLKLGLQDRPDLWTYNSTVRHFVKKNRNTRYVPESLLRELGLQCEEDAA